MRLKPRQYVLIVLIIGIGAFNYVRARRAEQPAPAAAAAVPANVKAGMAPAWPLYDSAAAARDADDAQWQPALKAVNDAIDGTNTTASPPQASGSEMIDLHGCQTWLLFYRNEHLHPTSKPGWLAETKQHVDSCVAQHRDIAR